MHRFTSAGLAALLISVIAHAQAAHTQLSPTTMPTARASIHGVTDGANVYVFGGSLAGGVQANDLWLFDGTDWFDITPATGPLPGGRGFYSAAWDSLRQRLVVFGGRAMGSTAPDWGDTWEFDGTQWTLMTPMNAPSPRRWAAMEFEPSTGRCILFGGNTTKGGSTGYVNETWAWDGVDWTLLSPMNAPSIRARGRLTHDPSRNEMIYFGGRNGSTALGETWKWDGSDWTQIVTANAPGSFGIAGLYAFGMTYDAYRDRFVVYGGTRTGGTLANTWEFDGTDWTQRSAPGPVDRTGPAVVYSPAFAKTYLYGGFNTAQLADTWEYQTSPLATSTQSGFTCSSGSVVAPTLSSSLPWLEDALTIHVGSLAPISASTLIIGLSNTSSSIGPLPFSLSAITPLAPIGCNLFVKDDATFDLAPLGGAQTLVIPSLNDPTLNGVTLHMQVLQVAFIGGGAIQITTSNALELLIGTR